MQAVKRKAFSISDPKPAVVTVLIFITVVWQGFGLAEPDCEE